MPNLIDSPPRPQALFLGFDEDDPELRACQALVANSRVVTEEHETDGIRESEWDILVANGATSIEVPSHMHVLALGVADIGMILRVPSSGYSRVRYTGFQPSSEMTVNLEDVPVDLARLVNQELVPFLQSKPQRPFLEFASLAHRLSNQDSMAGRILVADADGHAIAGHFLRGIPGQGMCLAIPMLSEKPSLWLAAAMEAWRHLTPHRFVDLPLWLSEPDWQTPEERQVSADLAALQVETSDAEAAFASRRQLLDARLLQATTTAESGLRRLLTATGESLVEEVMSSLKILGFTVVDADAGATPGAPKMEDLRLTDPDDPDWTNITEVKGYGRSGGKTSDLLALGRYAAVFRQRTGNDPQSRWYVVNQMYETAPPARPMLLRGAEEDLAELAQAGGLAIDTRHLFRMVVDVKSGKREASDVRLALRRATGRFMLS